MYRRRVSRRPLSTRRVFRGSRLYKGGRKRSRLSYPHKVSNFQKASSLIIRQPSGLPDRLFVKLRYREQLSYTQTSGTVSAGVYRGNSLYDPRFDTGGGQPYLFDQWAALYQTYRVLGSKVRLLDSLNQGTGGDSRSFIFASPSSTSLSTTSQEQICESPYRKLSMIKAGAIGIGQTQLSMYMGTAKILGRKKSIVQVDPNLLSAVTTDPANQWYWHVGNWVAGGQTQSLLSDLIITYYCVFETRQRPAIS